MSTGADCWFEEKPAGTWHYRLQCYPYGASEEYDTFGPFKSFEDARADLHANHANPGGFRVEHAAGCSCPKEWR